MGYIQSYVTNDGLEVSEGNIGCVRLEPDKKEDLFSKSLEAGHRVIERTDGRVLVESAASGKKRILIYSIADGACTHYISAPTLELALEFEKFLKKSAQ
jgi:hypothetical protein